MRSLTRLVATVATLVAAVLAAPAAAQQGPLTSERYERIDAVYTATLPLDRPRVPESAFTAARRACAGLKASDALLGPLRRECTASITAFRLSLAFGSCRSTAGCRRASARLREGLGRVLATARRSNRAIDATVRDRACRRALRSSAKELRSAEQLRAALRLVERALRSGSAEDQRRADRRLQRIPVDELSVRRERSRFRAACD